MIKSHNLRRQSGFTIVELLIVIVVIGILAALVLNSFSGVQSKARDTERTTDVKAISTQLEAYYNGLGNGSYPDSVTFTPGWAIGTTGLKGIDPNSLAAPGQTTIQITNATAASANDLTAAASSPAVSKDQYVYEPRTAGGALCSTAGTCTNFKIWYVLENAPTNGTALQVKKSLNQ
jgi:prepilin-type N-terminal cleavage/methylation domain-containing protein